MPEWKEPFGLRTGKRISMQEIIEIQNKIKKAKGDDKVDAQTEMLVILAETNNAACDDRRLIAIELGVIFFWLAGLTAIIGYLVQLHVIGG